MSYLPFRDNPDLAGITETGKFMLLGIAVKIDDSSRRALHVDQCNCDRGEECPYYAHLHTAETGEALGWLVGQGLLEPAAVQRWLASNP